jgi:hypothetical protein
LTAIRAFATNASGVKQAIGSSGVCFIRKIKRYFIVAALPEKGCGAAQVIQKPRKDGANG